MRTVGPRASEVPSGDPTTWGPRGIHVVDAAELRREPLPPVAARATSPPPPPPPPRTHARARRGTLTSRHHRTHSARWASTAQRSCPHARRARSEQQRQLNEMQLPSEDYFGGLFGGWVEGQHAAQPAVAAARVASQSPLHVVQARSFKIRAAPAPLTTKARAPCPASPGPRLQRPWCRWRGSGARKRAAAALRASVHRCAGTC